MKGGVKCCNWGLQERTPHPLGTRRSTTSGPISQWIVAFKYSPRRLCRTFLHEKNKKNQKTLAQPEFWVPQNTQAYSDFQEWSSRNPGQENKTLCWGFSTKDWECFFSSHLGLVQLYMSTNRLGKKIQVANFHSMGRIGSPKNLTPNITKKPSEIVKFIFIEFTGLLLPFPLASLSNICQGVLVIYSRKTKSPVKMFLGRKHW